jgi:hypothetical protein
MSKKEYLLENKEAAQKSEDELTEILHNCFLEAEGKAPSPEQETGLRQTAQCIKGGGFIQVTWKQAERGIREQTWDPARGPMGLFGDHG